MGLKRRNKVSAAFSMSSLTDIIFLLLIFFMLTSNIVAPNALNLRLPGTSRQQSPQDAKLDEVRISASGKYALNGRSLDLEALEQVLAEKVRGKGGSLSMTIAPARDTPTEYVVAVMDIAMRLNINGVLATAQLEGSSR